MVLFKVIDEQNTLYIPKYGGQNLCLLMFASLFSLDGFFDIHSANCRFDSWVKWWIHVSSIVTYLCKTPFLLRWNSCKQRSESSIRCFWSTLSKRGTHFEHSFLIEEWSCKTVNTLPSDIFNSSAISCNWNLRSARTSLWSFLVFSGTTAEFGRHECSASFVSVRRRLKSTYHLITIVSNWAESE